MESSTDSTPKGVTQRETRPFLVELANLPDFALKNDSERAAWSRFVRKFTPWVSSLVETYQERASVEDGSMGSVFAVGAILNAAWLGNNPHAGATCILSEMLRAAWCKPTREERETGVLEMLVDLAQLYATRTRRRFALVEHPIGRALLEAIHIADLMRVCLNTKCPARYFIAERRSQKFCSEACAEVAQREYKRRWWSEHGAAWSEARKRKHRPRRQRNSK